MLNATFRPLTQIWPKPRTEDRKLAAFKASYVKTLDLLEYELGKLRAQDVVIQIEDPAQIEGIRNDGSMRKMDRYWPTKPGVILSCQNSAKGALSFPCDRYSHWEDNLRAIGISLEALRAVDRYGVTQENEQYRGWTALPDPKANGKMSRVEAALFLAAILTVPKDYILEQPSKYIRQAQQAYHPDRAGTEEEKISRHEMFVRIGQAEEALLNGA